MCAGRVNESFAGQALVAAQSTLWMWQGEELRAAEVLHEMTAGAALSARAAGLGTDAACR